MLAPLALAVALAAVGAGDCALAGAAIRVHARRDPRAADHPKRPFKVVLTVTGLPRSARSYAVDLVRDPARRPGAHRCAVASLGIAQPVGRRGRIVFAPITYGAYGNGRYRGMCPGRWEGSLHTAPALGGGRRAHRVAIFCLSYPSLNVGYPSGARAHASHPCR